MKNVYLVTSAINTKFGVFDSNARFLQTLDTIKSIRAVDSNSLVVLIEMAALPLTNLQRDVLKSITDYQVDFTGNSFVVSLYNSTGNWDVVKNVTETTCFKQALVHLFTDGALKEKINRVFKVSGRYLLTPSFDPLLHLGDNFVFAKKRKSQFAPEVTDGCDYQYMSRCWSFPAARAEEVILAYEAFALFMHERLSLGGYVDLEHCLYKYLFNRGVTELDKIGVAGFIGPNGTKVED